MGPFYPHSDLWYLCFHVRVAPKCIVNMSIIVTDEDLCKKHDKVSAIFSSFSILPQKCCPAAV